MSNPKLVNTGTVIGCMGNNNTYVQTKTSPSGISKTTVVPSSSKHSGKFAFYSNVQTTSIDDNVTVIQTGNNSVGMIIGQGNLVINDEVIISDSNNNNNANANEPFTIEITVRGIKRTFVDKPVSITVTGNADSIQLTEGLVTVNNVDTVKTSTGHVQVNGNADTVKSQTGRITVNGHVKQAKTQTGSINCCSNRNQ
jgi:hypothetical protein